MLSFRNDRAGRSLWLERWFDLLAQTVGSDVTAAPSLAPVVAEVRAGREIKAAQVHQTTFACPLVVAMAAVRALKDRLDHS